MKFKFLFSLFLLGSSLSCFAQGYKDGIEYYKVGQYDNAKELLVRNLNEASTNKSDAYYYLGNIALKDNNIAEAKSYYDKGVQANAENPYNYIGLGALQLKANDAKAAEKNFKLALSKVKKDAKVATAIARAYYLVNPTTYAKEITKYSDQAKKFNAKDPDVYIFQGDQAAEQKSWGDAAGMYEMAFTFDPENTEAYVKYANTYFFVNPTMAIEKLAEVLAKNPHSALAQRELAEKYYENDEWTKAAQQYGEYIQNPNHFKQDEVRYAALLFYGKKYPESLELASSIVKQVPATDKASFYMKRLMVYNLVAMEKYPEAVAAAQDFFATPLPQGVTYEVKDFTDYGDALKNVNNIHEALAQYEKAVELNPDKVDLLRELSSSYTDAKEYEKAAFYYQKVIDSGNFTANDLFQAAGCYTDLAANTKDAAIKANAIDKARKYTTEANEKVHGNYRIVMQLATIEALADNTPKAVELYKEVLSILDAKENAKQEYTSTYKRIYGFLATTAFKAGDKEGAKHYYSAWLELDPENTDLRNYVNSMK